MNRPDFQEMLAKRLSSLEAKIDLINNSLHLFRETPSVPSEIKRAAVLDGAAYVRESFPNILLYNWRHETVKFAATLAREKGHFLEFGVYTGGSITLASNLRKDVSFWGFDSFEGLPEDWSGTGSPKGAFNLSGKLPEVPSNVTLVKGWFNETIPVWKENNEGPISYCNIDCDLYSSAVTIFKELEGRFVPGTVLHFDDYFGYPGWRDGEHKAFMEMLDRTGMSYEAKALGIMQFVVQLK